MPFRYLIGINAYKHKPEPVILDLDMVEKSEYVEENKYKDYTEIITDNIAEDIVNKDNENIFIPM
jgi:hypothetical protein